MTKFDPADTERGRHELEAEAEEAAVLNRPRRDFRIIRGAGGNYKVQYYATRDRRDEAAQRFADQDGTNVVTELWDASHSQDDLNQGWACDGHRTPSKENA